MAILSFGLAAAIGLQAAGAAAASSVSFTYTGAEQAWTVPAGVSVVQVTAIGGAGGIGFNGTGPGGLGAVVNGNLQVSPGEVLYIEVGGNGAIDSSGVSDQSTPSTFNGGGGSPEGGGGGGGASDVRTVPAASAASLSSRLIVAAGGGGGGNDPSGSAYGAGGNGGSPNGTAGGTGSAGGTGGTQAAGGTGGAGSQSGTNGGNGTLAVGGTGGGTDWGGGGGGGGLYGGGGGGGMGACSPCNAAGGGGGGSSLIPAGGTSSTATSGQAPGVTISYGFTASASVSPSSLTFSTTPQGTLSPGQTVTITNTATLASLAVSGLSFTGPDAADFIVESSTCGGSIAPGGECQVIVGFAPQGQGTRTAALQIASNDPASPATVNLSGTGGALPQGPPGAAGATGATGAAGASGLQGPAGKVELITCRTVTKTVTKKVKGKRRKVHSTQQKCTGRVVSGTVNFTLAGAADRATISRAGTVYASGASVSMGGGRSQLLLSDVRRLQRGRYTLTLTAAGRRPRVTRRSITIT